ncbi:MAG: WcaF family extracellular polysaccharide biosynthesis acetyltransferase [Verrucomicrobiia bacterium]
MTQVDLSRFSNEWYKPGSIIKRALWYIANILFFKSSVPYPSKIKVALLRIFGAKVGNGVVIKSSVNIKYPWFLEIGNNSWIGEEVWIDNLTDVKIGNNVCISQGVYLCTGNHNYKKVTFDLIVKPIIIEDGVWVGAKAIVCPGVTLKSHSVITAGSVVTKDAQSFTIYQGNPAKEIKKRIIE